MKKEDYTTKYTAEELQKKLFSGDTSRSDAAALVAKFMIGMAYYHDRVKLHVLLHPLFYLAGFVTAYYILK